mmetsp:Transcript_16156/g.61195  ORF Transcript_16156/g.61195 Transcript_16156/m.61195 type:complete len:279 (+) Transcript_16156:223-1059(+)
MRLRQKKQWPKRRRTPSAHSSQAPWPQSTNTAFCCLSIHTGHIARAGASAPRPVSPLAAGGAAPSRALVARATSSALRITSSALAASSGCMAAPGTAGPSAAASAPLASSAASRAGLTATSPRPPAASDARISRATSACRASTPRPSPPAASSSALHCLSYARSARKARKVNTPTTTSTTRNANTARSRYASDSSELPDAATDMTMKSTKSPTSVHASRKCNHKNTGTHRTAPKAPTRETIARTRLMPAESRETPPRVKPMGRLASARTNSMAVATSA